MQTFVVHGVSLEVTHGEPSSPSGLAAIAIPAESAQLEALGRVAIGEAWAVSAHLDDGPRRIKFAPPDGQARDYDSLLSLCYRKIVNVAERLEVPCIAVVLPGETDHDASSDGVDVACASIVSRLETCRHLSKLRLVAVNQQQEARCAECLTQQIT